MNFEDSDIKLILNDLDCDLSKDIFRIGLLTGMRISEIANMKKCNIDLEEDIITITESKTKSSIRVIPIHKRLLNILDFYYKNTKDEFLFGENSVNKLTKSVNKEIKKVINEKGKSFHSTRKNITMKMYQLQQNNKIQNNTIDRILGHKVKSLSFDVYNLNKIDLKILRDCINLVDYDYFIEEDELKQKELQKLNINNSNSLNLNF